MSSQVLPKYFHGFPVYDKNMEVFFQSIPAFIYCKNKKGLYLEVNNLFVHGTENKSDAEVFGKNDRSLIWSAQAQSLMNNDQEVICTGKPKNIVEVGKMWGGKIRHGLSYKVPLLDRSGKIMGIFGMSFLSEEPEVIIKFLYDAGFAIDSTKASLTSAKRQDNINEFTERQMDCLCYLVKGMTIKQIARSLNLSPRTIEHYLDNIKNKLGCNSRSELITKALRMPNIQNRLLQDNQ